MKTKGILKDIDAYYSRFFLTAALLPFCPIYIIITNPLGFDTTPFLSSIQQYPNAFIYYLYKCLLALPFIILSSFIILFALRKRIRFRGNIIESRVMFRTKRFKINDITMVKQFVSARGSITADVYVGSKCIFRMQGSLINYKLVIERFRSEHIEVKGP